MPDNRVYVYGSLDIKPDGYCSEQYKVFSSADMVNWTDHGISFDTKDSPCLCKPLAKNYPVVDFDFANPPPYLIGMMNQMAAQYGASGISDANYAHLDIRAFVPEDITLMAPDAAYKNGKYYLYFPKNYNEGVAVSDFPYGPFANSVQLNASGIDPAVFVDDDGQAYYYWGQFRASGAKLKPNMIEIDESTIVPHIVTEEEHGFHEGSSMRKHNGLYYFVYPSIKSGRPTQLAYAVSDKPLGPFTYRGVIIDNAKCDPQSWNIHGSIENVKGQWYVFYHRSSGNSPYLRRLCIEPITINADGSIPEVKMTSQGAGRPFGFNERIEGWRACELSGSAFIDNTKLMVLNNYDSAIFRYTEWEHKMESLKIEAAGSARIELFIDGLSSGIITVDDGVMSECAVKGSEGKHEISLCFSNVNDFTLYSIQFQENGL
jgi:hypothetical protein